MSLGISIVICCYNSARRLPETLKHLAAQEGAEKLLWEVIVIDNASTDNTAQVAKELWNSEFSVPLYVFHEPQPGLSYARSLGFSKANYGIISFIDDDNWVCSKWVQTIAEIMSQHPDVGACGGLSEAVSDIKKLPNWFEHYQCDYAVGVQAKQAGDITSTRGYLWGAGLAIRKVAWQKILDYGFQPLLTDRQKKNLTSCGDYELCRVLCLTGWRLWYDPRLQFKHYLPASRLQWSYLRRLKRGFGAGSVGLDAYHCISSKEEVFTFRAFFKRSWYFQVVIVLLRLLFHLPKLFIFPKNLKEGSPEILRLEILIGRLSELWQRRKLYKLNIQKLLEAPWLVNQVS